MEQTIQQFLTQADENWRFSSVVKDNFIALYTIARHDKSLLEGAPLASIMRQLISIESKPGGPYYSSFSNKDHGAPKTFEIETNTAIARFLGLYDIELPAVTAFLGGKTFIVQDSVVKKSSTTMEEKKMLRSIRAAIKKRVGGCSSEVRQLAVAVIEKTIKGNTDKQMSLMSYYMVQAIGDKKRNIPTSTIVDMSVANIMFWTAFIIYDDFWDEDEAADTRLLPIANLFARSYIDYFLNILPVKSGFRRFFHGLMDDLDAANVWETTRCRATREGDIFVVPEKLPSYGNYIHKYRAASGHVLGPVAVLCMSGHAIGSVEVKKCIAYFQHYLIAMQLNDDMHDWEEDLHRGHISTAVAQLLADVGKKELNIVLDIDELRKTFWFVTLPKLAKKALSHTEASRDALYSMKSISDMAPLEQFIRYPERAAREALESQKQSVEFLERFAQ